MGFSFYVFVDVSDTIDNYRPTHLTLRYGMVSIMKLQNFPLCFLVCLLLVGVFIYLFGGGGGGFFFTIAFQQKN